MSIFNMVYGKKQGWEPWSNTVLYLPMETDYQDHSSNWYTMTLNSWSLTKDGYWYVFSGSQFIYPTLNWNVITESWLVGWSLPYTINVWAKSVSWVSSESNYSPVYMSTYYNNWPVSWSDYIAYWTTSRFEIFNWNSTSWSTFPTISASTNWHMYTFVIKQNQQLIYQDAVLVWTFDKNYILTTYTWNYNWCLRFPSNNPDYSRNKWWTVWITIVEKWERDIDKITLLYNQTKSNYWL